ncbi:tetratricopeptide repeat protein [Pirellulaceae bacterium SH467]
MNSNQQDRNSVLAIFACCLLVLFPSRFSSGEEPLARPSEVALTFQRATEAFAQKDFASAKQEFLTVARATPNSELAIQAEYFAALAGWNLDPSDPSASEIQRWLEHASTFETQTRSSGKTIVSPSWDRWVEAAHLLLAKYDLSKGSTREAERRLRQLSRNSTDAKGTDSRTSEAWPTQSPCSPHVWLELGSLLCRENPSSDEALECFAKAIEACQQQSSPSHQLLQTLASWNAIECVAAKNQWQEVCDRLKEFAQQDPSSEFRIRAKLLEITAKKKLSQAVDVAKELEPIVDLALAGNIPAQLLYDLGVAFADAGSSDSSEAVFLELIQRYPETGISIEARLRLARDYAQSNRWDQAIKLSEEATELGCPDSWKAFAWYIRAKGHALALENKEAIQCFERGLDEGKLTVELEITLRVELLELLYRSEQWSKIGPHAEWLLAFSEKEPTPPTWLPLVMLRQAETLANRNAWQEAESMVSTLCRDFPKWKKADEADYLLARCCIARADFQGARERLDRIAIASSNSNATLLARAGWMAGETFMMQRRYAEAAASYQRVLSIPGEEHWHAASVLQLGVCAEMSQDPNAAVEWYRRVQERYPESPFAKTASERLSDLMTKAKQAERIGSGKKR